MDGMEEPHELDKYLLKSVEKVCDLVAWWWDHQHSYPTLLKMAFNYLSVPHKFCASIMVYCWVLTSLIPATSTAVECVFSQGQQLLHFTHNQLSGVSIQAVLCFGDWGQKDLIDSGDVFKAIRYSNQKCKRKLSEVLDESEDS